jgi:hypothetical protein
MYNSLFTFKDVENKFETCLQNWYRKYDELEPVYQLYFGALYGQFVYLNLKFLCFVQALETYHRRALGNEELPRDKHEKRIKNILDTAPIEYKNWLKYQLKYGNEPNLQRRFIDLFDKFTVPIRSLIPDENTFIKKVVDTRNYMTHYDLTLKEKSAIGKELFLITERLRILLETCLLSEIGFNSEEIKSLLCKRYQERLRVYEQ